MLQCCLVSPDLFHKRYFVDERRNCRWNFKGMSQLNRDCCHIYTYIHINRSFFLTMTLWQVTGDVMSLLCFRICAMKSGSRCTTRRWFIWRTPGAMDGGILLSWEGQWREAAHQTWEKFTPIRRGPSSHVWCGNDRQSWKLCSVQCIIRNIQKIHVYYMHFFWGGKLILHDSPLVRSQWFLTGWIHEGSLVESKRLVKNPWKSQRIRANMPTLVWFSDEFSTEELCFFVNLYPLLSASWPKSLRVCNWLGCRSLLLN